MAREMPRLLSVDVYTIRGLYHNLRSERGRMGRDALPLDVQRSTRNVPSKLR